ncbi:MAG: TMEM14 family protein [Candidatus Omnitrophota bacterium]
MKPINVAFLIYGILMFVGGFIGFAKAGSKMSLIMGIVSGLIIILGVLISLNNPQTGYLVLTVTTTLLSAVFISRLIKTQSFMPSGMLLIFSLAALAVCVVQLIKK